jgi:hypothetical protein
MISGTVNTHGGGQREDVCHNTELVRPHVEVGIRRGIKAKLVDPDVLGGIWAVGRFEIAVEEESGDALTHSNVLPTFLLFWVLRILLPSRH